MPAAAVRILHPQPAEGAGELARLLGAARELVAVHLAGRFEAAGAGDVRIVRGRLDATSFGQRLGAVVSELAPGAGLVVLGSGSIPLASDDDLARLVATAGSGGDHALTNNRYSADVVAVPDAGVLAEATALTSDNALPRWLEARGLVVDELADRERLAMDVDSPLDVELLRRHPDCPSEVVRLAAGAGVARLLGGARHALGSLRTIATDPTAELLVAGRISAATLAALERGSACRVRALVEERGLRTAARGQRPPASALGLLLEAEGPASIADLVPRLAGGALIDSRVVLAHRLGASESAWPSPEDRYASDLLLPERIEDPWLRELTAGAAAATRAGVPIALGGHTLVGPGIGLALGLPA